MEAVASEIKPTSSERARVYRLFLDAKVVPSRPAPRRRPYSSPLRRFFSRSRSTISLRPSGVFPIATLSSSIFSGAWTFCVTRMSECCSW